MFWSFGFSLFEFGEFLEGISIMGWLNHSVHEQIDTVRPVFEIIEWFKVIEAVHELVEILVERGIGWFRNPSVGRFR